MGVFFDDIQLVAGLMKDSNSNAIKIDLRAKYDLLCQAMKDPTQNQIVLNNLTEYAAICNLQVMEFALASASIQDININTNLYEQWSRIPGNKNTDKTANLHKVFEAYLVKLSPGLTIGSNRIVRDKQTNSAVVNKFTLQDLSNALNTFGVKSTSAETMTNAEDLSELPVGDTSAAFDDLNFGEEVGDFGEEFEDFGEEFEYFDGEVGNLGKLFTGSGELVGDLEDAVGGLWGFNDSDEEAETVHEEPVEVEETVHEEPTETEETTYEEPVEEIVDPIEEPVEEVVDPLEEPIEEPVVPIEKTIDAEPADVADETVDEAGTKPAEDNPDDDPEEEEKAKNLDEQIEQFKNCHLKNTVNTLVGGLVRTFMSLYESGFTGIPQEGILFLTDGEAAVSGSPVILIDKNHQATPGSRSDGDNYALRQIYNSLKPCLPEFGSVIFSGEGERVPSTESLLANNGVCFEFHLALQSRSIAFTKGLISIRRFITQQSGKWSNEDHKIWLDHNNNGNQSTLTVIKQIKEWYKWATERVIYKALIDKFGTVSGMNGKDDDVQKLLICVASKLKNVMILDSREKGAVFTVKMSHSRINSVDTVKEMADKVSSAVLGSQTKITAERAIANNVGTIDVIVDAAKANSANLFAADVVDKLLDAGIRPSWSNCMLGKSAEGGVIFWDKFKDPSVNTVDKRCYTIYAGSRSGKGVMTSTLIASAVSEGVDVFYVDGKPENGPCLGLMAWEQGMDAFVYDGKASGSAPFSGYMENYTNGVRSTDLVGAQFEQLPDMFGKAKFFGREKFIEFAGLMRYLKSLYLMLKFAAGRGSDSIPKDKWNLWVFDEMTSMCKIEADIRDIFVKYLSDKGVKTTRANLTEGDARAKISKGKFLEEGDSYDPNVAYIDSFKQMMNTISKLMSDAKTISIGKADMNIVMIFQNASWLKASEYSGCIIRDFVALMGDATTKIVGKGALADGCKQYGESPTLRSDWYTSYVNTEAKWWAISESADIRTNKVTLFKPYQIWTIPNHMKPVYATEEDVARIKAEDPSSNVKVGDEIAQNGTLLTADEIAAEEAKHPGYYKKFFAGYMKTLEQKFGFSTAQILGSAYNYANESMNALNINFNNYGNITEFIYDCVKLIPAVEDATQQDVNETLGNGSSGQQMGSGSSVNFDAINNNGGSDEYGDMSQTQAGDSPTPMPAPMPAPAPTPAPTPAPGARPFMEPADPADTDGIYQIFERRLNDPNYRPNGLPSLAKMINSNALMRVSSDEGWDATQRQMYMRRFDLANKVAECRFNPQEKMAFRDADKKPSLRYQVIAIGCLWIVTHNGGNQDTWNQVKVAVFNKIQQFAGDVNHADKFTNAVITHGIMDDIDNSVLGFTDPSDKSAGMPTDEMLRGYLDKAKSGQTQANPMPYKSPDAMTQEFTGEYKPENFEYNDVSDPDSSDYSWENQPEQAQPVERPFFTGFGDATQQFTPRPTQNVGKPDANAVVVTPPTSGGMYKMKKRFFETVKGTSYALDQYWEAILNAIAKSFPDTGMISKVHIYNDRMKVNGRNIDLRHIIGGEYGLEMCDIVNIPKMMKRFKGIRELALDEECERCLLYQYGMLDATDQVAGFLKIFDAHTKLQKILVMVDGKSMQITRTSLMAAGGEIGKHMQVKTFREKMDGFSSAHDKKLASKSPGRIKRFSDTMGTKTGGLFESAYKQLVKEDPSIGKALGLGIAGMFAGAVTVGGKVLGAPVAIFSHFKNR